MENASKALIIAGSILLAIAIVGVGMTIFNNVTPLLNPSMDEYEIAEFNNQFKSYEGTQKGNNIQTLIDRLNANNRANSTDASKCVKITSDTSKAPSGITTQAVTNLDNGTDIPGGDKWSDSEVVKTYSKTLIKTGKNYVVSFTYDTSGTGLITEINIVLKAS